MKSKQNDSISKLGTLFALARNPIIGICSGKIAFANPAAVSDLNIETGMDAENVIPEHILSAETSDSFVCSAAFNGLSATASAARFDDVLVLYVLLPEAGRRPAEIVPKSLVSSLRTSATTLRLSADLLLNSIDVENDSKLKTYASMLYHSYFTMLRLTVNLDTINSISIGDLILSPRLYNVGAICSELLDTVSHMTASKSVNFRFEAPKEKIISFVDREKFEQMLLNMLSNSLAHTSPNDTITVSLRIDGRNRNNMVLSVDDTGAGISTEIFSGIFSRFDQNLSLADLAEGSGLGLNIAKGIAERHGGALIIESNEGEGTRIRVMLPINQGKGDILNSPITYIRSMNDILRELSVVLGYESYDRRYMD